MTFKPCLTIALFKPINGTTSQIVPNDINQDNLINWFYEVFSLNQFLVLNCLFSETRNIKDTPAAHKYCKLDLSSTLFGFTIEKALVILFQIDGGQEQLHQYCFFLQIQ